MYGHSERFAFGAVTIEQPFSSLILFLLLAVTLSSDLGPETYFRNRLVRWWILFLEPPSHFDLTNRFGRCSIQLTVFLRVSPFFFIWIYYQPASHLSINNNSNNNNNSQQATWWSQREENETQNGKEKNSKLKLAYRTTLIWSWKTTRLNINRWTAYLNVTSLILPFFSFFFSPILFIHHI